MSLKRSNFSLQMSMSAPAMFSLLYTHPFNTSITKTPYHHTPLSQPLRFQTPKPFLIPPPKSSSSSSPLIAANEEEEKPRVKLRWIEIGPNITQPQNYAISQLPPRMTKRCKSLMKQLICFDSSSSSLEYLLLCWAKIMKPKRVDWLVVLKELAKMQHPLLFQVTEFALVEESFEPNVRDYTKLIDGYAKQNQLQDAETAFQAMKARGFICDQITLTVLLQMYSKADNLHQAEETFEEIKLLGLPLDKRSYGSMIMAYIRAGLPELGERLLIEMDDQQIYAGKEVYKALLRAYSTIGEAQGAQRVFDAIQFAGIAPDVKLCALLINAYGMSGQNSEARSAFENLRSFGLKPSDKCVAVMLAAYEKENMLSVAMDLLIDLEKDGVVLGQEASDVLVRWFCRLGVVKEVALVLSEYAQKDAKSRTHVF